jgi:phosphohistidine phosphatase
MSTWPRPGSSDTARRPLRQYDPAVIYLLRHGEAVPRGDGDDSERALTRKGEEQSIAAGRALVVLGAELAACLTSPKVRAAETARLTCAELGLEPETSSELKSGPFDPLELSAGRGGVLLVGHEPSLSTEVASLTGGRVKLRKGGMALVDGTTLLALWRPEDLAAVAASRR